MGGESETLHRFPINDPESPCPLVAQGSRSQHPSAQALVRGRGESCTTYPRRWGMRRTVLTVLSGEDRRAPFFVKKEETAVFLLPY